MIITRIADDTVEKQWDGYVRAKEASAYFLYGWKRAFKMGYGLNSFYIAAFENDMIVGLLPVVLVRQFSVQSLVSLPFLYHGGIIADNNQIKEQLLSKLQDIAKKLNVSNIQLRMIEYFNQDSFFLDSENVFFTLELFSDGGKVLRSLDEDARNRINKSLRYNFKVRFGAEGLESFYIPYSLRMRELGTPCHNRRFFESILREFPLNVNVATVWHKDKVVAGMFFTYTKMIFSDMFAASLYEYRDSCANYFLYWQAIQFAIKQGCHLFDFERSQKGSGAYKFKKQWGTKENQLYYYNTKNHSISGRKEKYKLFIELWKRQPLFIANRIGPIIRKTLP